MGSSPFTCTNNQASQIAQIRGLRGFLLCAFIALAIVWPLFSQNCSFTCFSALSELIIDEAQDLITSKYLDVFDKCLSGGLRRGAWTFLGDFSQQAIYNKPATSTEIRELLEDWTSFIRFKLNVYILNSFSEKYFSEKI